jgi:hypothetical protein
MEVRKAVMALMLKLIFEKWIVMVGSGYNWLRISSIHGTLH